MTTELIDRTESDVQTTLLTASLSAYVDKIFLGVTAAAAAATTTLMTTPTTAVDVTSSDVVWSSSSSFSDVDYNESEWMMNSTGAAADVDDGINTTAAVGSRQDMTLSYVYFWLTTVVSILSIVGSVLIITTDVLCRDLRSPGRRMLTWLSLADCLTAIGNTMGVFWFICCRPNGIVLCQFHAALTIFSSISSFLWTVAIATHLYLHVCRNNAYLANRLVRIFHFTCWIIPGIVSVLAWSLNVLGRDDVSGEPSWCWIKPTVAYGNTLFWQYLTGKAWELACYVAIVCLYVPVKCTLHRQVRKWNLVHSESSSHLRQRNGNNAGSNSDVISDASRKLILIPVVFLSLRIWGTVRFIVGEHWESQRDSLQWIAPLQAVGDSAQGIANCILFCFLTRRVRQRYSELLGLRSGTRCCKLGSRPSNETPCIQLRLRRVKREAMSDVDASNIQLQRVDKITT